MRKTLVITSLCLAAWVTAALVLPAVQGAVYKWVDADGKVHYSQSPPLDRPAEKVKMPSQPPADAAPKAQAPKTIGTEKEPDTATTKDQNQAAQKDKKETKKEKREKEAQRQENCDQARRSLEGLESRPRARKTEPDGTLVYMTDEERQAAIEQSRQGVSDFCQ